MSNKILLVTVGGSHKPVVTAIEQVKPDRVVFICSKQSKTQVVGEGTPCEVRIGEEPYPQLPNIPTQAKMNDRFQAERDVVLLEDQDDFEQVHSTISQAVKNLKAEYTSADILANYTAGTKTMSVVLGIVAIDYDLDLYLTKAKRIDLYQIKRGETTERSSVGPIRVERKLKRVIPSFISKYDYPPAITQLEQLLVDQEIQSPQKQVIRAQLDICRALEAWDCFNHIEAWLEIEHKMGQLRELGIFFKRVMTSRSEIDPSFTKKAEKAGALGYYMSGHGYELVEDLLLNAERRAFQKRFDDAVGRLYRALELLVQIRLRKEYDVKTDNVDLGVLPSNELRQQYKPDGSGKVKLSLRASYEFLCKLEEKDPLGQLYQEKKGTILSALRVRNHSLFGHGFEPVTESRYEEVDSAFVGFIRSGIDSVISSKVKRKPIQFPQQFDL